jgi:hypothetical protein
MELFETDTATTLNKMRGSPVLRAKERVVTTAELWFEAIIGGQFNKIPNRQGELLAAIEEYRQLKRKRR